MRSQSCERTNQNQISPIPPNQTISAKTPIHIEIITAVTSFWGIATEHSDHILDRNHE